jgi:hypothetical protein
VGQALYLFLFVTGVLQTQSFTLAVLVADRKNGMPIVDALVKVPARGLASRADSMGEVRFRGLDPGLLRVNATRVGYAPMTANVIIGVDDTATVVFLMQASTANLDTVRVNASRSPSYLREFEARRTMGLGRFLTEATLDSSRTRSLADVVATRFAGLHAQWSFDHMSVAIASTRGSASGRGCVAQIFIDGYVGKGEDLAALKSEDVGGVEYYSNAPPVQYARAGPGCGTIIIWTKRLF